MLIHLKLITELRIRFNLDHPAHYSFAIVFDEKRFPHGLIYGILFA